MKPTRELIFAVFILHSLLGFGQQKGIISEVELKRHLEFLASDSLQGRNFSTAAPGLDIAAGYLRENVSAMGLLPGAENFIQPFALFSGETDPTHSQLTFSDKSGAIILKTDSLVGFNNLNKTLDFSGEMIFAGFGWQDKESEYNDFEGIDVDGKIVAFSVGIPKSYLDEKDGKAPALDYRLEQEKISYVLKSGAKGVIVFTSPGDIENRIFARVKSRSERGMVGFKPPDKKEASENSIVTLPTIFDKLSGQPGGLESALEKRAKGGKTEQPVFDGQYVSVLIPYGLKEITGKNIAAVVEGSDPELKNECVVFMAHYDHLGVEKNGDVFNGADDNGSGTVALLELARSFQNLPVKPKRSMVFLWVTGEEIGMFGSRYYSEHPAFPLEKTQACINLDMVGRLFEPRDTVWKKSPKMVKDFNGIFALSGGNCPELVEISDKTCKNLGLIPDKSLPPGFLRASDHFVFYNKGVPVINYSTGYHADYHKPSDEVSKIDFAKMKKVAELCFGVGYEVANRKNGLTIKH